MNKKEPVKDMAERVVAKREVLTLTQERDHCKDGGRGLATHRTLNMSYFNQTVCAEKRVLCE